MDEQISPALLDVATRAAGSDSAAPGSSRLAELDLPGRRAAPPIERSSR